MHVTGLPNTWLIENEVPAGTSGQLTEALDGVAKDKNTKAAKTKAINAFEDLQNSRIFIDRLLAAPLRQTIPPMAKLPERRSSTTF